jgi:hypothetical protein
VIFGNNKKRKRWEAEDLDGDENEIRKIRRIEERHQLLLSLNGNIDADSLDKAQKQAMIEQLREEEDMSETEIQKQLEQNEFHHFKKQMSKLIPTLEKTSLGKEKKEDEELK